MITARFFVFGLLLTFLGLIGRAADAPLKVATYETAWSDPARADRVVPVKIYYPADLATPCPVIVFSHGLGGSREGYAYLGEYWAAHGYISVHLQHAGSDEAVWKGVARPMESMKNAVADPANARNRPRDVSFVLDRLTALNADARFPLHGRLDLAHAGLAGHSFGAYTTLATVTPGHPVGGYDPRFKAAIAMSAPAPRLPDAYDGIRIPVFHMTGTEDVSPIGGTNDPKDRRIPYDRTGTAPAYLLTFKGGDHMVFSGRLTSKRPTDGPFQALICSGSLAFWNATLKNDANARHWLEDGGFAQALGALGTFEQKHP